ncbi:Membrane-bound hydrogenase, subunit NuoL [Thermogladius calderae 1633]|uniref:Membrane-bound hydrogenase, subunit NuoL n=1 Tax=Thermogladius calderae (strain DSM 22663 / VKM B-2946 / 1633) TaxID=1184251 RepID=I3TEY3_THEC1|nr:NADH-quinone oxidoreductase subunit L [Thermogladius calderae]AFK51321.1 Membrane-bound hydrogenase, subunit NuoL [Thermogladius calderae 1633]
MYASLTILTLATGIMLVLLLHKWRRAVELVSVSATGLALLFSLLYSITGDGGGLLGLGFFADGLSRLYTVTLNFLGLLILTYSVGYMSDEEEYTRYYTLMLLFIASMNLLLLTTNIVVLYVSWELVGVCSALLIAYYWWNPRARSAGVKAFVVTRIGDMGLIAFVSTVALKLGSFAIPDIISHYSQSPIEAYSASLLLLLAAVGKSAQFPLHIWLPDAMEGPTPVSALLHSATMVKAGVYLVSRFYPLFAYSGVVLELMVALSVVTIILSGLAALASVDIKRVLAYSTINNIGLMFLALSVGNWLMAQLHFLSHALFKSLLFLSSGTVTKGAKTRSIDELGGMWSAGYARSGFGFLVGALSTAGVPPLPGFFTKAGILLSFLEKYHGWTGLFFVLLVSLISPLYIFRAFFRVYTGKTQRVPEVYEPAPMAVTVMALTAANLAGPIIMWDVYRVLNRTGPHLVVIDPFDLSALALGVILAYSVWYSGRLGTLRVGLRGLSAIAREGFYLDALLVTASSYSARFLVGAVAYLKRTKPPVLTLWIMGFLLVALMVLLGVY